MALIWRSIDREGRECLSNAWLIFLFHGVWVGVYVCVGVWKWMYEYAPSHEWSILLLDLR